MVAWLSELPSVRLPGAPLTVGRPSRWKRSCLAVLGCAGSLLPTQTTRIDGDDGSRRRIVLPPGAVWFPLPDTDEPEGSWTMAPSIVARNADVMRWVDHQLAKRRSADGLFPPHIVLGQMKETTGYSFRRGLFRSPCRPITTAAKSLSRLPRWKP